MGFYVKDRDICSPFFLRYAPLTDDDAHANPSFYEGDFLMASGGQKCLRANIFGASVRTVRQYIRRTVRNGRYSVLAVSVLRVSVRVSLQDFWDHLCYMDGNIYVLPLPLAREKKYAKSIFYFRVLLETFFFFFFFFFLQSPPFINFQPKYDHTYHGSPTSSPGT